MSGEAVKVAVRCRPFNQRERDRNAKVIIDMEGMQTMITNPSDPSDVKTFAFDFSYWSHDGYTEGSDGVMVEQPGGKYASQERVFRDLGQGVLDNAFAGYNCSLFAYGQTGSGKSYSMVGYGANKGIVPITCEHLFKTIEASKNPSIRFQVTFSMLEIYNEQVRDLLNAGGNPRGGLPIRQHPTKGFYVDGLRSVAVNSFAEIERRTDEGTRSRTVAATQMNATSSRAHTVVTITFEQIIKDDAGQETNKSSTINLVDLAGSERADSTGATGDRLKEGANINRSLTMLGNVISALAEKSSGKKNVLVPYRDSALTKLLQNALGGNSKTVMIAALSPADINYDETLSTLRYADRAKKIKNKAIVNENPTEKLIRELREENEKLKAMMSGESVPSDSGATDAEKEAIRKQLAEELQQQLNANERDLQKFKMSWEDKLKESREHFGPDAGADAGRTLKEPHILNLNEDPMLSGKVLFFVNKAACIVGKKDGDAVADIPLNGLSIQKKHAIIRNENGVVTISPGSVGARVLVNGIPLSTKQTLKHLDRLVFGSNHLFYFVNPDERKKLVEAGQSLPTVDYDFAQKELAQARGFGTDATKSQEDQKIQDEVVELLPMVTEVNAISEELNKQRSFEIVLLSSTAQNMGKMPVQRIASSMNIAGMPTVPTTRVMVKMKNLSNGNTWMWDKGKFTNRKFIMEELYQRFLDGEDVHGTHRDSDPFWEPPEDVLIGSASLYLKCLGYAMDIDEQVTVTDYKGAEEGTLEIQAIPCTEKGTPLDEDAFVDEPTDLLGKPYYLKLRVNRAEVKKARFAAGLHVKYAFFREENLTATATVRQTTTPEFNHVRLVTLPSVDPDIITFFDSGCIVFELWGTQTEEGDSAAAQRSSGMTTEEMMLRETNGNMGNPAAGANARKFVDLERDNTALRAEIAVLKRRGERMTRREKRVKELVKDLDAKPEAERDYAQFKRSVSAVYTGTTERLKAKIQVMMVGSKMLKARNSLGNLGMAAAAAAASPSAPATAPVTGGGTAAGGAAQPPKGGSHGPETHPGPSGAVKSQACVVQ